MKFVQRLKKLGTYLVPVVLLVVSLVNGEDPVFALLVFASEAILAALFMWIWLLYFCRSVPEVIVITIGGIIITALDFIMSLASLVLLLLPVGLLQSQNNEGLPFPTVSFIDNWIIDAEQQGYSISSFHHLFSYFFTDLWYVLLLIPFAIELTSAIRSGELKYVKGVDPAHNKTLIKHLLRPLRKSGQLILFSMIAAVPVYVLSLYTNIYWLFVVIIFVFRIVGGALLGKESD